MIEILSNCRFSLTQKLSPLHDHMTQLVVVRRLGRGDEVGRDGPRVRLGITEIGLVGIPTLKKEKNLEELIQL